MHEMSITQEIIDLCLKHTTGRRVLSIDVEIGELTSVMPEAVEFCFEACTRETLLEGASLNIFKTPGIAQCNECNATNPITELYGECQKCGSSQMIIISGEELRVREIEVED